MRCPDKGFENQGEALRPMALYVLCLGMHLTVFVKRSVCVFQMYVYFPALTSFAILYAVVAIG